MNISRHFYSSMAATRRVAGGRAQGFSLVELLVAMGIGLVLMTILATVFANSSRSQKEITMASQQVENGRYAIELLGEDLHHAGFYGYYMPSATATVPGTLPDPCSTDVTVIRAAMVIPVQGYNSASATPLSCINSSNFLTGTDILVVRRVATAVTASASLDVNTIYVQASASTTSTSNPIVALGNGTFNLTVNNGSGAPVAAPIRAMITHIYYISPCSTRTGSGGTCTTTADGGTPIPTLYRLELTKDASGTAFVDYPMVEGIQNLQVEYGVDSDDDGSPNSSYVTDPGATTNWRNMMALRVYLLARNTQLTPGYTDSKTYNLGSTVISGSGGYRRHVYDTLVRMKNPSERRELP